MNGSWHIGRIAGIDLKIHPTFLFLLIWVGFSSVLSGGSIGMMASELIFILALFLSVVLHELGHALMAKRFKISTTDITLLPIGGIARLERMPEDPKEELWVAAAGPAVNIVISAILFAGLFLTGVFSQPLNSLLQLNNFWLRLFTANLTLVVFNLIPAFPMDGGRVLRAFLALRMDHVKATQIAANIGRGLALIMGIYGIFTNPWLAMIAVFVWTGAGTEAKSVALKANLSGLVVRDALISQFYQVEANQPLSDVFQLLMKTGQQFVPVTSNGRFLGIIQRNDLVKALERLGDRAPAYAAIGVELQGLHPEMPLSEVLEKFSVSRIQPVIENDQLIGLVTPESVQQCMWLHQRMNDAKPHPSEEKTTSV